MHITIPISKIITPIKIVLISIFGILLLSKRTELAKILWA